MKTRLRWFRRLPIAALVLFTCAAGARPLLVPPQNLSIPLSGVPQYEGQFAPLYYGVAIDSGTMLVSGQRAINTQNERIDGVYIFERNAAGRWAYAGILTEQWSGAVMLNGTVADDKLRGRHHQGFRTRRGGVGVDRHHRGPVRLRLPYRRRVYLRATGQPLQQSHLCAGVSAVSQSGWHLDAGRHHRRGALRLKRARTSTMVAPSSYTRHSTSDLQPPAETFAASSGSTWTPIGSIPAPPPGPISLNWFGPWGTIRGDTAYIDRGYFYRYSGGAWVPAGRLVEPEIELAPYSYEAKLRGNNLVTSRLRTRLRAAKHRLGNASGVACVASLSAVRIRCVHLSRAFERRLRRVELGRERGRPAGRCHWGDTNDTTYAEPRRLYVFEVPDTTSFPGTTQDTFSAGNFAAGPPQREHSRWCNPVSRE